MTKTEERYYRALRKHHGLPAGLALRYAKDYAWCLAAGVEFSWELETENPVDVFGEPDPVNGPFYDKDAVFECCVVRGPATEDNENGHVLDSLGMIDGAHSTNLFSGYWFLVECEMAGQAKDSFIKLYGEE